VRAWYRTLDYLSLLTWAALVAIGLVAIYSTTHGPAAEFLLESVRRNYDRQMVWGAICLVGILVALLLPVRLVQKSAPLIYLGAIGLLVAALLFGREINGARSWLSLGSVQLQVSEFAKVGAVLGVAYLVGSRRPGTPGLRFALAIIGLLLLPALLIILQNDTGTALIFIGLIPVMLFWAGVPVDLLMLLLAPAVTGYLAIVYEPAAIGFAVAFTLFMYIRTRDRRLTVLAALFTGGTLAAVAVALTRILQPHQVARVLSFTRPGAEEFRHDVGFHLVQSLAAIGSGGLSGKGFMQGTQTQGRYVPEQSTDFVFSVIGEEFGFVGSALVLLLFLLLLVRLVMLGSQMKHPFGMMVAAGTAGIYLIHVFVNVGMATAVLPVIGIPLPFISYGGSALMAHTALLAITLSLHMRRDDFSIYVY
jgi:rod shape determining protein RodA